MASSRGVDANLRLAVTAICLFALLLRYATSLHPYSGHAAPPMYGDYEAHRHWMEVTTNLPVGEWYVQSANNDLQYWGIDYPPLSAYLSWVFGHVAARTYPDLVALHASRGHESAASKLFMRSSVLSMDALVFFPAALLLAHARGLAPSARLLALGGLLLQPALILVDHGHFQYNCVSLGLALGAQALTLRATDDGGSHGSGQGKGEGWPLARSLLPAAVLFCLSLNFKQMSLYYAPAFFCHMLGLCLRRQTLRQRFASVAALGITVVCTCALCWLPFLRLGPTASLAVLRRVFPVQRHIYEDKVANLWCTLSVIPPLKLRALASAGHALRLSLGALGCSLVLPAISMAARPSRRSFELGLVSVSLSFFLLSFQVHEKHILLALAPASALLPDAPLLVGWLSAVGCFSMFPLLERDGLGLAYAAHLLLLCPLVGAARAVARQESQLLPEDRRRARNWVEVAMHRRVCWLPPLVACSAVGMAALHAAAKLVQPPARYPDIFPYLFCAYACAHFCAAWLVLQAWHACHLLGDSDTRNEKTARAKAE